MEATVQTRLALFINARHRDAGARTNYKLSGQ